jgi:hypothetical protein
MHAGTTDVTCFSPGPEILKMSLDFIPIARRDCLRPGELFRLRFRVVQRADDGVVSAWRDGAGGTHDVRVLLFLAAGTWQLREWAEPVGEGVFEVVYTVPQAGTYYVFFECPALRLSYDQVPYLVLQATGTEITASKSTLPRHGEAA